MGRKLNLINQRFGKLVVISDSRKIKTRNIIWECKCDCGKRVFVIGPDLKRGHTKSCGCLVGRSKTHGKTGSKEYISWQKMKERCFNPVNIKYANYGGRGITVCEQWKNSFENFFRDMGPRPSNYTLDRIHTEGDYEPGNCRWASSREQNRNRRDNVWVEHNGKKIIQQELLNKLGIKTSHLLYHKRVGRSLNDVIKYFEQKQAC